jgi:hypothetical protein
MPRVEAKPRSAFVTKTAVNTESTTPTVRSTAKPSD